LSSGSSTPDRATQEIALRMALARALMATKGYSREVEEAYATALKPFEGRELPQLFPVLRSLASYYIHQSQFDEGARIGREILHLAERQQDTGMLVDGHLIVGICVSGQEGISIALEHLDEAIAVVRAGPSSPGHTGWATTQGRHASRRPRSSCGCLATPRRPSRGPRRPSPWPLSCSTRTRSPT
jgi:hypothetical protein